MKFYYCVIPLALPQTLQSPILLIAFIALFCSPSFLRTSKTRRGNLKSNAKRSIVVELYHVCIDKYLFVIGNSNLRILFIFNRLDLKLKPHWSKSNNSFTVNA